MCGKQWVTTLIVGPLSGCLINTFDFLPIVKKADPAQRGEILPEVWRRPRVDLQTNTALSEDIGTPPLIGITRKASFSMKARIPYPNPLGRALKNVSKLRSWNRWTFSLQQAKNANSFYSIFPCRPSLMMADSGGAKTFRGDGWELKTVLAHWSGVCVMVFGQASGTVKSLAVWFIW